MLKENIPILTADPERRLCKDEALPWNFIIEGDNLQALYLLEKTHKGKVDCIYIDPPYNSGAHDWKYNNDYVDTTDSYRHSKWLSMIQRRLEIAKTLLNPRDSVLIVTIDEKEYLHLGCLLEDMFPEARIQMVTNIISAKGVVRPGQFSRVEEFIFFVEFGDSTLVPSEVNMLDETIKKESNRPIEWLGFRRRAPQAKRESRPNQFYPIFVSKQDGRIKKIGDVLPHGISRNSVQVPEDCVAFWPLSKDGDERMWSLVPEQAQKCLEKGYLRVNNWDSESLTETIYYLPSGTISDIESGKAIITGRREDGSVIASYSEVGTTPPKRVWNMKSHNAETYGSNLIRSMIGNRFNYPKSLYAEHDTMKFFIANKHDATILDFFAGSGTTMHAVNLLNAEDGGNRKCIMVTNNEISEEEEKEFSKKGITKGSDKWESHGIAKYVTWPRTVCSIEGKDVNGKALSGNYIGCDIPMSYGFNANVKFFKCDWTPRKPEDYLLSNMLCLHIKEMIELQNAIEVDNVKNVLLLNKADVKSHILDVEAYGKIERVWVNQNIVLSAEELKLLEAKGYKYIPKEFFGQELREAAE